MATPPWGYFDTSVLVKRYVKERGSARARALLGQHRILSSAIAPLELVSALCRRRAMGEIAEPDFVAIRSRIREDQAYWELVEVSALVLHNSEGLIEQAGLRVLDAVHVASAIAFQTASGIRVPFITADGRQRDVAREFALDVAWVG